jgi:PAS domain S-box-containing protein
LQDLTGTRRAVLQAELGFREMLINAPEAILMTESDGDIVFANRLAAQIFGFEETELIGKNVDSLVPERLRSEHRAQRAHFFGAPTARRMGSSGQPICGLRKDGSEFPAEVVISSTRGGGKLLAVSFISDVTAQRVTARNIRTYQTRLQRMAFDATVSEDRERRRIAADLHDGIGQALALAQFKLSAARKDLAQPERAKLDEVIGLLEQSVSDTRTLTFELSPPLLYELGLKDALSWLVEDLERRHQLRVQLESEHDDPASDLEVSTAAVLYRAVRELLLNVFKHAQTPTASVFLRRRQSMLEVEVVDTGRGFAAGEHPLHGAAGGFGLFSVREQIERVGGCVEVHSAPGLGTRVKITVPIAPVQVADGEVL